MATAYQLEVDKVKELLGTKGAEQVKVDICIKKALEFVVENAKEAKPSKPRTKKAKAEEPEEVETDADDNDDDDDDEDYEEV